MDHIVTTPWLERLARIVILPTAFVLVGCTPNVAAFGSGSDFAEAHGSQDVVVGVEDGGNECSFGKLELLCVDEAATPLANHQFQGGLSLVDPGGAELGWELSPEFASDERGVIIAEHAAAPVHTALSTYEGGQSLRAELDTTPAMFDVRQTLVFHEIG